MERTKDAAAGKPVGDAGKHLVADLTALEDSLVQKRVADGQTVINFPSRLRFQYVYLRGAVDGAEGIVTDGAKELFGDLSARWARHEAQLEGLLGPRLAGFNQLIAEQGIPAVIVPQPAQRATTTAAPESEPR